MESNNKINHPFITELEKYFPEIVSRLQTPGKEAVIDGIEGEIGEPLPEAFKELYAQFDGEQNEPYTGLVLGFVLMDTENILDTLKLFRKNDFSEITSLTPGKVSDEKMCDRILVPFAWDGSRGYFCLDMSPDTDGMKGQVVALDLDMDECTWLADSLEGFFTFVSRMLQDGKCHVEIGEEGEKYFDFESGHFFNVMKELLKTDNGAVGEVELSDAFWIEKFKGERVAISTLQEQTRLMISKGAMTISLAPIAYMTKLRKLIIHDCTIRDFESICGATELKKIYLVSCTFDYEKLSALARLPKLKELYLGKMPLSDIRCLAESKSLKILGLRNLEQFDATQLTLFSKLQELEIDEILIDNLDFLKAYKALKVLEFHNVQIANLDFLQYLKKLTRFKLEEKVQEERGLQFLKELLGLKEFDYPVSDMAHYTDCAKLEQIGIDAAGFCNPECLQGSSITSIMVYNAKREEDADAVIDAVKQYLRLSSYGMTGDFLD